MRDDLLDAYAACDWAVAQLPVLQQRLNDWIDRPAYAIVEDSDPQAGKKFFKIQTDERLGDALINAEIGALINSIRSGLDLLASALARRNGKIPSADRHFPIYLTLYDFIDPLNVQKRKQFLSEGELKTIESLKPYRGGNDLLFALHHLDVIRKHERLLKIFPDPTFGGTAILSRTDFKGITFTKPFSLDDGTVIGWADINAPEYNLRISVQIIMNEVELLGRKSPVDAIRDFSRMASTIVEMFK